MKFCGKKVLCILNSLFTFFHSIFFFIHYFGKASLCSALLESIDLKKSLKVFLLKIFPFYVNFIFEILFLGFYCI